MSEQPTCLICNLPANLCDPSVHPEMCPYFNKIIPYPEGHFIYRRHSMPGKWFCPCFCTSGKTLVEVQCPVCDRKIVKIHGLQRDNRDGCPCWMVEQFAIRGKTRPDGVIYIHNYAIVNKCETEDCNLLTLTGSLYCMSCVYNTYFDVNTIKPAK